MKTILIFISTLVISSTLIFHTSNHTIRNQNHTSAKSFHLKEGKLVYWMLDSSINYSYIDNEWKPKTRTIYNTEDTTGIILRSITHSFDTDTETWLKKDTCIINFYDDKSIQEYLVQPWNANSENWEDTVLFEKYDETGNKTVFLSKTRDYKNNSFISGIKTESNYNENTLTAYYEFLLDTTLNEWDSLAFCSNTLTEGKITESEIHTFNAAEQQFVKTSQKVYSYNVYGYKSNILYRYWKSDTEEWIDKFNYVYDYSSSGNLLYEQWPGKHQFDYSYNTANDISSITIKVWNNSEADWQNSKQYIYTYENDDRKIEKLIQIWDQTVSEWIDFEKEVFYWTEHITVSVDRIIKNTDLKVYPNPTTGILIFNSTTKIEKFMLKDLNGKTILEKSDLSGKQEFDLSAYPAGIYLLHLQTIDKNYIEKIIKE